MGIVAMRFMATPADAPLEGEYGILVDECPDLSASKGESETLRALRRCLELYRPGFRFRGFIDDLSRAHAGTCILVPDVSHAAIDAVLRHYEDDRLIFVPIPLDVDASWVGLVRALFDQLRVRDGQVFLDEAAFASYLSRIGVRSPFPSGIGERLRQAAKELVLPMAARWLGGVGGFGSPCYGPVLQQLDDDSSRSVLRRIVERRANEIAAHHLQECFRAHQYLDTVRLKPGDVVISGGVFRGEELPGLTFLLGGRGKIYCFDPAGAADLLPHIKQWAASFASCFEFVACALARKDGTVSLRRRADGQLETGFAGLQEESVAIPAVSIDGFVEERALASVDLVKLDIEGSEEEALLGAVGTLRRFRPQLAISIYHRPTSYVEIPAFLMRECRDYRWQIKHYSFSGREVVLYGFPRERMY